MELRWNHKSFSQLSVEELYQILKLRVDVFVNEQQCFYPELDDKDQYSTHLWTENKGEIIAYARLVPPGISYPEPAIGRVITNPIFRGNRYGKLLVQKSINMIYEKHGKTPIQIGAQTHLKNFYGSFGFEQASDEYLDYGIPHIDMIKP
ncbi:GNAT family N-acetyltransferase [Sphingobacterium sp. SRCM116780]|uniref:GNAT family N-acetyltransferase n=1 Tax=Sphingobacterium sp. SRCM116780 TaxID=2907623 RepID=UPI001F3E3483|nr:GNAT family N-acetyltransferase [Sphingobacterium sp. SRCM116780]UIR57215.1 GNAT family N-acetyltransferase [Sphingobacterium sp. SRCM116780]